MKNLYSVIPADREDPGHTTIQAAERPKKIRIVFEDDINACSVEVLLKSNSVPVMIPIMGLFNHYGLAQFQPRASHES